MSKESNETLSRRVAEALGKRPIAFDDGTVMYHDGNGWQYCDYATSLDAIKSAEEAMGLRMDVTSDGAGYIATAYKDNTFVSRGLADTEPKARCLALLAACGKERAPRSEFQRKLDADPELAEACEKVADQAREAGKKHTTPPLTKEDVQFIREQKIG